METFNLFLSLDSQNHLARHKLGVLYFRVNRLKDAERQLIRVLKEDSGRADSNFYLAVVYVEMGRFDAAEAEFRAALVINPKLASARTNLEKIEAKDNE